MHVCTLAPGQVAPSPSLQNVCMLCYAMMLLLMVLFLHRHSVCLWLPTHPPLSASIELMCSKDTHVHYDLLHVKGFLHTNPRPHPVSDDGFTGLGETLELRLHLFEAFSLFISLNLYHLVIKKPCNSPEL